MDSSSKDFINDVPDELLCHILSYLTTKEAASTSLLSRRWRYLLAFLPILEFDDSIFLHEAGLEGFVYYINGKKMKLSTGFTDFVDRILDLQGNFTPHKFSLKMFDRYDPVGTDKVIPWIHKVLVRGVLDLQLVLDLKELKFPARIFLSETLVKLHIEIRDGPTIDVKGVHLPKLKTLYLKSVMFKEEDIGFIQLLSGCHVLEELFLDRMWSCVWTSCSVSVPTLKRLTFCCINLRDWRIHEESNMVSFDTPNLVYLEYAEVIADEYLNVNFDSLVEAKIDIWMTDRQIAEVAIFRGNASVLGLEDQFAQGDEEINMVGNATDFILGICNVRVLCLSAESLEVLTYCCKPIPIFSNLTHLTIKSNPKLGWESLPNLLNSSPCLETLVFQGLLHKATEEMDVATCLSSSPVKVLKISISDEEIEKQIEQVKHFLETMPHLEQLVLYYDLSFDGDVKVSSQLQMLTRVASPKCKVQLIPIRSTSPLSVSSSTVPISLR